MSSASFDIIEIVEDLLRGSGWKRSALQPGRSMRPGFERQTKIYESGEDVAVICRPFSPFGIFGGGRIRQIPSMHDLAEMFDEYLRRLADVLGRIRKAYNGRFVLVFQRGGIPIPEWFLAFCRELGITIEILDDSAESLESIRDWSYRENRVELE